MPHKLHDDVRVFAMGFILDRSELEALAQVSLPADFLAIHSNDGVQAFKWRATEHEFEVFDVLPKRDRFFIAVHFYPWFWGCPSPPELEEIPNGRFATWNSLYGRHLAHKCEVRKKLYPHASLGTVFFLQRYIRRIVATHGLIELLVPVNTSGELLHDPIDPVHASSGDPSANDLPAATAIFAVGSTISPKVNVQPTGACTMSEPLPPLLPQCKPASRSCRHEHSSQAWLHECTV
ncbi:hypothetical protein DFH06DRAFT_1336618 [Mycena polygramma]|nr:hypothetical protein DFH06DRAFT_1336618 [Mycena polygramma]